MPPHCNNDMNPAQDLNLRRRRLQRQAKTPFETYALPRRGRHQETDEISPLMLARVHSPLSLFPFSLPNPKSTLLPRPRIESHARSLVFSFTRNVSPLLRPPLSVRSPARFKINSCVRLPGMGAA